MPLPHVHQGWNNCGATSCAMLARTQGKALGGWDYKRLCPGPPGTGTDWGDLLAASKRAGLRWKLVTFPPDDAGFERATAFARAELDAARPVVIDFKVTGPEYAGGEAGHTLALVGYVARDDLYVLCNPALATPGLQLMGHLRIGVWPTATFGVTGGRMSGGISGRVNYPDGREVSGTTTGSC